MTIGGQRYQFNKVTKTSRTTTYGDKYTQIAATKNGNIYATMEVIREDGSSFSDITVTTTSEGENLLKITANSSNSKDLYFYVNGKQSTIGGNTYYNTTYDGTIIFSSTTKGYIQEMSPSQLNFDNSTVGITDVTAGDAIIPQPHGRLYRFFTKSGNGVQSGTYYFKISFVGANIKSVGTITSITI